MSESRAIQMLRQRADEYGWTLPELAADIGVPFPTLSGWIFHGKHPKQGTIERLDRAGVVEAGDWFRAPDPSRIETVRAAE